MKLQISFNQPDLTNALAIASRVAPYADIIEIGTLLIYHYGIESVKEFHKAFPDKTLLADIKIIDHGKDAVNLFSQSGITWLTVMAGANKNVIRNACNAAHNQGIKIMLNLSDASSLNQAALEAESLGVDALLFREPFEQGQLEFFEHWDMVRGNTKLPVYLNANITRNTIASLLKLKAEGFVIGNAITAADNPATEAQFFKEIAA